MRRHAPPTRPLGALVVLSLLLLLPALLLQGDAASPFVPRPTAVARRAARQQRCSSSGSRRYGRGAFMNFRHHDDGAHEGKELGRSGVWASFRNATDAIMDRVEDATDAIKDGVEDALDMEDEKKAIKDFIARERVALEHLENHIGDWWSKHKSRVRLLAKGLTGATLACTGTHFGRCVILFHTLRVTGWPSFKRAIVEVGKSYQRARQVVKEEVSDVVTKPGELMKAIGYEISSVTKIISESQEALEDGKLTHAEAQETIKQADVDMKRLSYEAWVVNQALDSFAALAAAIDVAKLQDVFSSVYTGALACVASANSIKARKISMSFDLGSILAQNTDCLAQSIMDAVQAKELRKILPPETRRFVRQSINVLSTIEGLVIVNALLPRMSLRVTSAALGGAWLADALAETLDPTLKKHGWPVIEGHVPYVLLSAGFTAAGYGIQKRRPGKFPFLIQRALLPLTMMEERLKALKLFKNK